MPGVLLESSVGCAPSTELRSHLAPVFFFLQVPEGLLGLVSGCFGREMDACVKMPGSGFLCKKGPSGGPSCGAWLLFGLHSGKLGPVLAQLGYFGHFKMFPVRTRSPLLASTKSTTGDLH